jgi:hypothetical protein
MQFCHEKRFMDSKGGTQGGFNIRDYLNKNEDETFLLVEIWVSG